MFLLKNIHFLAVLLVISFITPFAGAEKIKEPANQQFEFANNLFNAELYKSSIIEFQRFLFLYPKDDRVLKAHYQIALAYQKQKKYFQAIETYQKIIQHHPTNEIILQAAFLLSDCYILKSNYHMARTVLESFKNRNLSKKDRDKIYYHLGWLYIKAKRFSLAEEQFLSISDTSKYHITEIQNGIEKRKKLSRKNPTLAGILSIIPGLGQAYCGRYRDAMLSFIVNGIIGWASWESYDNNRPALGTLLTFFGMGFYSGNIYGATNSAHKFNRRIEKQWERELSYIAILPSKDL
ncbi:secreted protein containing TM2 domain protein [Candidatus Magnetomorum sp. HK-1]|nr:secreted protein containing TM2 domain protein [Candidatus Magnetomorum sp. HK-1]